MTRSFILLSGLVTVILIGCGDAPLTRHYEEVFIEADSQHEMPHAKHAGQGNMPQDAIHAGLDMSNMPPDDVHAGLDINNMPQDDIHAGFASGNTRATATQSSGDTAMSSMAITPELERSVDRSPLSWQTPDGWQEKKGSGLRLATFTAMGNAGATETSIISLGGQAGGLEANVTRWMRQVNISVGTPELQRFLATQEQLTTASGLQTTLIDLTQLQKNMPTDAPSMIAAILNRERSQIFIKMTGSKAAVSQQLSNFRNLIMSVSEK